LLFGGTEADPEDRTKLESDCHNIGADDILSFVLMTRYGNVPGCEATIRLRF
jgi:hypothetical protein